MLFNDSDALNKAYEIINKSDNNARISRHFWVQAENQSEDIFCYFVVPEKSNIEYPPGALFPLFKRNGEMTEFVLPIPVS